MWRSIASNALSFLVVAVFLFGGTLLWAQREYSAQGPLSAAICLKVERGSNFSRVSQSLVEQGAISSGFLFRVGADYSDKTAALKAGSFLVDEGASMAEIVDVITRGGASTCGTEVIYRIGILRASAEVRELDPNTQRFVEVAKFSPGEEAAPEAYTRVRGESDTRYRIALAEGVTSWQVVEEMKALDVLDGTVAELPAEGSLAPDSYEVSVGTQRADVIAQMQNRQKAIIAEAWANRADDLPLNSMAEMLTLASIVEKETGVAAERGQVASVFINRLNQGMRLQTDPTVIYGITLGQGSLGRGLRQSELRRATPYNTYVIDGLPPTPIANPGAAAIQATVNPDQTDYLFFVADGTGGHAFAETLAEHNENVARWRRIEAENAGQ
ncbi:endolytic transglycosylase MltG [Marinovum sp. 2_MG-2023]|uniref:endolytic transglycosylase MltG n=1 Tax=unclassified Marinovum TaxID=2647166 RepID=UPI0026E17FCB|nr:MULTISPECIES: endolytic transglycosylase MltG [unclassified Marinovum]MDO6731031.1 endolytic transglycosylase MltG [Marinovum sp. 2_MG-2023]MDO6778528.1 endolytic transglycosylase MltG [Marinovum sp. 1_MG-2023]